MMGKKKKRRLKEKALRAARKAKRVVKEGAENYGRATTNAPPGETPTGRATVDERGNVQAERDTRLAPLSIAPKKVMHNETRELIVREMLRIQGAGWFETNLNPRKPDAQIAVEVLKQLTVIAASLAERDPKPTITHEVINLAAQTVMWVQGLTYQKDVKAWT